MGGDVHEDLVDSNEKPETQSAVGQKQVTMEEELAFLEAEARIDAAIIRSLNRSRIGLPSSFQLCVP